jgi:hypothetical protein
MFARGDPRLRCNSVIDAVTEKTPTHNEKW